MIITLEQYANDKINHRDFNDECRNNAIEWVGRSNLLLTKIKDDGIKLIPDPDTGCMISGNKNGNGGFRLQSCPEGAPGSTHKKGKGGDISDPLGMIDIWCIYNEKVLEKIGIWLEHPLKTPGWSHWQSIAPGSGKRFFVP